MSIKVRRLARFMLLSMAIISCAGCKINGLPMLQLELVKGNHGSQEQANIQQADFQQPIGDQPSSANQAPSSSSDHSLVQGPQTASGGQSEFNGSSDHFANQDGFPQESNSSAANRWPVTPNGISDTLDNHLTQENRQRPRSRIQSWLRPGRDLDDRSPPESDWVPEQPPIPTKPNGQRYSLTDEPSMKRSQLDPHMPTATERALHLQLQIRELEQKLAESKQANQSLDQELRLTVDALFRATQALNQLQARARTFENENKYLKKELKELSQTSSETNVKAQEMLQRLRNAMPDENRPKVFDPASTLRREPVNR